MIFIKNDTFYATVWSVENKGNYTKMRISTSEKKQDGTYENSSWFCSAVGNANNKAKYLKEKDRIKVVSAKLTNVYNANDKKSYLGMAIFDFEPMNNGGNSTTFTLDDEDDIPF